MRNKISSLVFISVFYSSQVIAATLSPLTFKAGKSESIKILNASNQNISSQYNLSYSDLDPAVSELTIASFNGSPIVIPVVAGSNYKIIASHKTNPALSEEFFVSVVPGAASKISVVSGNSQSANVNQQVPNPLVVKVLDTKGNAVSNASISWSSSTGSFGSSSTTSGVDGTSQNYFTNGSAIGTSTATASLSSNSLVKASFSVSAKAAVGAGVPNKLSFSNLPTSSTKSAPFSISVSVLDSLGSTVSSANNLVTVSAFSNSSCSAPVTGIFAGSNASSALSGVATLSNLSYNSAGTLYLKASSQGLVSACSRAIAVLDPPAETPAKLAFIYPPLVSSIQNKVFAPNIKVALQDIKGKIFSAGSYAVSISAHSDESCSSQASGQLSGVVSVNSSTGYATFSNISYSNVGNIYLKAQAAGLSSCSKVVQVSQDLSLVPAALKITQVSNSSEQNKLFSVQPKVYILNNSGGIVTSGSSSVTLTAYSDSACSTPASTNLSGSLSSNSISGVASFSGISHSSIGTIYIKAVSGSISSSCSSAITITQPAAGTPNQLAFFLQPSSSGSANVLLSQQPKVEVQDFFGSRVTTANLSVSIGYYSDSSCLTPVSGSVNSNVFSSSGLASFSNIKVSSAGTYYLKASSGTLKSVCSNAINVVASVPVCLSTEHLENNVCVSNVKSCSTSLGSGTQSWNGSAYSSCVLSSCLDSSKYLLSNGACSPISCTLANANILNAASVSGDLVSGCSVVSCSTNYSKSGNSCVAQACSTSDVVNSLTVSGNKVSGCQATSCSSNYTLSNGSCSPTSCSVANANILNAASVSGDLVSGCSLVSCSTNYTKTGNSCVATACTTADVANSISVFGDLVSGCSATLCSSGYKLRDSACFANAAPVASSQAVTTDEDTSKSITLSASDFDGDTLSYSVISQPAHGSLTGSAPNLTYTPNSNYSGTDSFTFKANDGLVDSNIATVSITINSINDAPVAVGQSVSTDEDTAKSIILSASDIDTLSPLNYIVVSQPAHGSISGTAPNLTYTPAANYNGSDSFTFKANDGSLDSNIATVSISVNAVNDAPVISGNINDTLSEDSIAYELVSFSSVTTDPDSSSITWTVVTPPAHGTLSGIEGSAIRYYTPDANFNGSDSFVIKANDGLLDSNLFTVGLTINPVNDAPVSTGQIISTNEDTAKDIILSASDIDAGSSLTYIIVSQPANGTLSVSGANVTYTPNLNYNGSDSFTFKANDGIIDSNVSTVSITVNPVNDAPVAISQSVSTNEDTAKDIILSASDIDAGSSLTYIIVSQPANGTLSVSGANVTYTPNLNYNGSDSFTFKANDGSLNSNIATVSITINAVNDAPVAVAQSVTTNEDTAKSIILSASDVDAGSSLTYTISSQPSKGILSGTAPNLTYTPNLNYNGSDSFTFKANDGSLDSNIATVSITVNAVNDAPVAVADSYAITATAGSQISIPVSSLLSNDTDVDNTSPLASNFGLTVSSVASASTGTVSLSGSNILFTPSISFNGNATFSYTISDGSLTSSALVTVPVVCASGYTTSSNTCVIAVSAPTITNSFLDYKNKISANERHTCAVTNSGGVRCWGVANVDGSLGNGSGDSAYPIDVAGISDATAVKTSYSHTCALTSAGGVKCWGANESGQLGDGTTTQRLTPVAVTGLNEIITDIAVGQAHSCALKSSGSVVCWGANVLGQLGNGTTTNSISPVQVTGLTSGVVSISSLFAHTCALKSSGAVVCWGLNDKGQLGNSSMSDSSNPVPVTGLASGVVSVSSGFAHTCALKSTGAVICWGWNSNGQLGNSSNLGFSSITPVAVTGLGANSGVISISAGYAHTCASTLAGEAKCWGYNYYGSLGNNTTNSQSATPVNVSGLSSGVVSISAGMFHTCALTSSGVAKCWGDNSQEYYGLLGDGGLTTGSAVPVVVSGTAVYSTRPSEMNIFGTCSGGTISHSPTANTLQNKTTDCIGGNYLLKLSYGLLNDVFTGISSPNRKIKTYSTLNGASSQLSNGSVDWPTFSSTPVTTTISLQPYDNNSNYLLISFSEPVRISTNFYSKISSSLVGDFGGDEFFPMAISGVDLISSDIVEYLIIGFEDMSFGQVRGDTYYSQIKVKVWYNQIDNGGHYTNALATGNFSFLSGFAETQDGRGSSPASVNNVKIVNELW